MTVKELSQLYWLNREIEQDQKRLAELERLAMSPSTSNISNAPSAKSGYSESKIERYVAEIVDLKAIIAAKQQQCIHERNRLERWICDVPDSLLRLIFTLRYVNGLTWYQVALHIGGGNTEASVKMACYRYLDNKRSKKS